MNKQKASKKGKNKKSSILNFSTSHGYKFHVNSILLIPTKKSKTKSILSLNFTFREIALL